MKFGRYLWLWALCVAATVCAQSFLPVRRPGTQLPLAQLHPSLLKLLSFGHTHTAADILYLQIVSLWGDYSSKPETYDDLAPALEQVVYLDPCHKGAYLLGGTALTLQNMDTAKGMKLLERGAQAFPNDWRLLFLYGFNLFDLHHDDEGAAAHLARAAVLEDAPPHLALLAASLSAKSHRQDIGIAMLDELLKQTSDPSQRSIYERRMAGLLEAKRKQELP